MTNVPRCFYTGLFYLLTPVLLIRLWWRGRNAPGYRQRWWQRFGFVPNVARNPLWIHAVSVGETIAIAPFVERLLTDYPDLPIVITTMTPTGASRVKAIFAGRVIHYYCPYDLPDAIGRFIQRVRPRGCLIVETELWPNMILGCEKAGVPVIVANARLSERSAKGYAKVRGLVEPMLSALTLLVTQHQSDADRFFQLGMPAEKMDVSGSIKFDIQIDDDIREQGAFLRQQLGSRFTVILASSHEDEETQFLSSIEPLIDKYPNLLVMLVPRHPERFESVYQRTLQYSDKVVRRSTGDSLKADQTTKIYLGDTMGDLMLLYAAADVAVMGGSFVNVGGHNPLEPAVLSMPVIMGPYHFNFTAISNAMAQAGGMQLVTQMSDVPDLLEKYHASPIKAVEHGRNALAYADSQRGALDHLYIEVTKRLI
ncbi:lipid IV(A) 3-deoxy-D-manno-octulosonic acid transferase [Neptunomonas japonica]|uniref:lipid IV(A) 3-deoxy-D-manno-octulosonic acid transferase n=1 Tax=Neptunomonas japonica TaxID=417574 RepID=UPI0003FD157D|nr:lipid IV(A) 3-deoxy-D-manno-octulosonic acid transferase [Neptunomonas japonica]